MKKSIILGGSILCLFILVSLSYQPIVADMPIETIPMAKESKASNLDADEIKELYTKLLELKSQSNNDCGCDMVRIWPFPIICITLYLMIKFVEIFHLWPIGFPPLLVPLYALAGIFNCPWA
ncbi:MAG: hypothetical protein K8R68_02130 [Bacteroidales bacterium]|nr:hypothetical protein [Bacteroidales bacterium]